MGYSRDGRYAALAAYARQLHLLGRERGEWSTLVGVGLEQQRGLVSFAFAHPPRSLLFAPRAPARLYGWAGSWKEAGPEGELRRMDALERLPAR